MTKIAEIHPSYGSGVQAGTVKKTDNGILQVNFPTPFKDVPVVIVTPNFVDAISEPEKVFKTTNEYFQLNSQNNRADYFVNWIAFGPI